MGSVTQMAVVMGEKPSKQDKRAVIQPKFMDECVLWVEMSQG
jgi:hypothetical protein